MKSFNAIQLLGAASVAVLLTGCFDEKMPEVNDINCQHENILKIEDKAMQQDFASKCLRRGNPRSGEFKASPEKDW
ncbi:entry exclusion lipoprotein TrbK [Klebsiella pneumoniae]|uniref:entry exclusion lipoprotein TrbK n=1 Tax=Klebsiella pneumoniae TaxID=573 RepID=UPI001C7F9E2C|nr:entry exclusion lipoprotein TrbK [Klebsiella pneumoniae]MBX4558827.1 entry exclusion lipoprotein TrbK [Klebsiella pneumoniae]